MMTDFQTVSVVFLLLAGSGFALIAAIGIVRMPDLFCRMHAATKAGAFGVSLILFALVVAQPTLRVLVQAAMIIAFFYLTAPIAAQMIGSAAIHNGVRIWRNPERPGAAQRGRGTETGPAHSSDSLPHQP